MDLLEYLEDIPEHLQNEGLSKIDPKNHKILRLISPIAKNYYEFSDTVLLKIKPTTYDAWKDFVDKSPYAKQRFSDDDFFQKYYDTHVRIDSFKGPRGYYYIPYLGSVKYGEERIFFRGKGQTEGNLYKSTNWKDDLKDGEEIEYYTTGKIRSIRRYKNGLEHGFEEDWDPRGWKYAIKEWNEGKLINTQYFN